MPTVRLEFELDSEVYPELHAALSSLRNTRARSERMRQLAAAGLVWEKVRLHGTGAAAAPAADERTDLVTRLDVNPQPPSETLPLPALERRAAAKRTRSSGTAEKRRASEPEETIDLAINAEPMPVPPAAPERRSKRPSREELEQVMRELPVLMDVVADVRPLPSAHDDDMHDEPAPWAAMNAYPDDIAGTASNDDDDDGPLPDASLHVTALSHKPATRSRLMRMKERGLFKNG